MALNANITLMGDLDNYLLEGDHIIGMNLIYDRLAQGGIDYYGGLSGNATIEGESGLRHDTIKWERRTKTCTVFFVAGNSTGNWVMQVFAYGKHPGENNKEYALWTFKNGKKSKKYEPFS